MNDTISIVLLNIRTLTSVKRTHYVIVWHTGPYPNHNTKSKVIYHQNTISIPKTRDNSVSNWRNSQGPLFDFCLTSVVKWYRTSIVTTVIKEDVPLKGKYLTKCTCCLGTQWAETFSFARLYVGKECTLSCDTGCISTVSQNNIVIFIDHFWGCNI